MRAIFHSKLIHFLQFIKEKCRLAFTLWDISLNYILVFLLKALRYDYDDFLCHVSCYATAIPPFFSHQILFPMNDYLLDDFFLKSQIHIELKRFLLCYDVSWIYFTFYCTLCRHNVFRFYCSHFLVKKWIFIGL